MVHPMSREIIIEERDNYRARIDRAVAMIDKEVRGSLREAIIMSDYRNPESIESLLLDLRAILAAGVDMEESEGE